MRPELYEYYRHLQDCGVDVNKHKQPPMNAGGESETIKHIVAKSLVAYIAARDYGYMTGLEVETRTGEIDVLLWGHPERLTYAVEVETSPTEETKSEKLDKYVREIPPIDDMVWINLNEMPMDMVKATEWIQEQL